MKSNCGGCGIILPPDAEAYVCSYDCTFCLSCYSTKQGKCPDCGGELVRRPRRVGKSEIREPVDPAVFSNPLRSWQIWAVSFGVWTFIAFAGSLTIWQLYRTSDMPMRYGETLGLEFSQILTYIPLAPFAFLFAVRYPVTRQNWGRRSLLYLGVGILFCVAHVALRSATPYAVYDAKHKLWTSLFWDPLAHKFAFRWPGIRRLLLYNIVDDITGTFFPIVLVAHAISYYRKFQSREIRATQLEALLAKAHLQSLKSQLQPHFLFNTMHSVSALMLTDIQAADRMITRLADLLRMNLESAGTQITSLSKELEFVNCYLEIEQVRFEEKLSIKWDVAPETLDAQVPLLLLQPLVDNAVKHGISRRTAEGEIRICSYVNNGDLKLEVRDNGPGLTESSHDRGCGLGLRVTRERLETLYGTNQSLILSSLAEGGVSVLVTIPFRSNPGRDQTGNESGAAVLQEHSI